MRLKKIELLGFKSFADKTGIVFDEGVTCIVGPNGCGKSNISDAIRWVLGERSARLLRGSKMEDVIFNGTEFRKPLAFTEVSLTLDNQDRGLPIDYQEVILTRRLYRSGESEYFINRTACRLKDIQDLILDTGIGSNSYSMIEQGRIDYILSADAEERRSLIEEAAGISKYKVKKEEALRKLERTEENRLRLNDIVHEVQKNIQYAERQARRAARYQEELEKLKDFQIRKAFYELKGLSQQKESLGGHLAQLQAERDQNDALAAFHRKHIESSQETLREVMDRFHRGEAARYTIQSKMDQAQQGIRFNQEKRIETAARLAQIEAEKVQVEERIKKNTEDLRLKAEALIQIQEDEELAQDILGKCEQACQAVQLELDALKSRLEGAKLSLFQAASDTAKIRNEYHRLDIFLQTHLHQNQRQEASAGRLRQEAQQLESRKAAAEQDLAALTAQLAGLNAKKEELDREISGIDGQREVSQRGKLNIQQELQEKQARLNLLSELDRAYCADETALLKETEELNQRVTNLKKIFSVQPGFEWALEAALESFTRCLIVKDLGTAENLLQRIHDRKPSSMGLLIHERVQPQRDDLQVLEGNNPSLIPISQVVRIQDEYAPLFTPFFQNVFIVTNHEDFSLADLLPLAANYKLIASNGVTLGPHGRIFYKNQKISAEDNPFKRTSEINALQGELAQTQELLTRKEFLETAVLDRQQSLKAQREALEAERLDALVRKESLDSLLEGMKDRLAAFRRELELIEFESRELEDQQAESAARREAFKAQLEGAEANEKSLHAGQEFLARELESLGLKKNSLLHEWVEHKAGFSNILEKSRLLGEALVFMKDHDARDRERITALGEENSRLIQKEFLLKEEEEKLFAEQNRLSENQREADIALELVRQEKERGEGEKDSIQANLNACLERLREIQMKSHQCEMKLMDLGFQEKNIADRLLQTYRIRLSELNAQDFPIPDGKPFEELEKQIADLSQKVEALGTVNLLAIEEYEELKKRHDFLLAQQKDLEEAREQLLETIRKINRTTKGLFEETFGNIQKTFQEYYQTLFRGGHAKLVLLDELNPLESGIDIVVRPPGKKLQNISLLSGGEKALTAAALLFALFKIKPSPFCVLDEVDAPLDEANIDRFLSVLRTFLDSTQFIIVTHNRKTIGMGDSLYGVTMEEPGISKLVSVKISQPSEDAPPTVKKEPEHGPVEEQISI